MYIYLLHLAYPVQAPCYITSLTGNAVPIVARIILYDRNNVNLLDTTRRNENDINKEHTNDDTGCKDNIKLDNERKSMNFLRLLA